MHSEDLFRILVRYTINNIKSVQYLRVYLQKIDQLSNECQYPYYFPYCLLWYRNDGMKLILTTCFLTTTAVSICHSLCDLRNINEYSSDGGK